MKMKFEWEMDTVADAEHKAKIQAQENAAFKATLSGLPLQFPQGVLENAENNKGHFWMDFVKGLHQGLAVTLGAPGATLGDSAVKEDRSEDLCSCSKCIDKLIEKMDILRTTFSLDLNLLPGPEALIRLRSCCLSLALYIEEVTAASEKAVAEAEAAVRAATAAEGPTA